MAARAKSPPGRPASARQRIDHAAYELFSRHSIRSIGVDTVAAHAGVAKMTLYKHYPSKDELALAFLRRRDFCRPAPQSAVRQFRTAGRQVCLIMAL